MKLAPKRKSRKVSIKKPAKRTSKSQAAEIEMARRVEGVNRGNTLANWVADMKAIAERKGSRGDTLGSWLCDAN